MRVLCMCACVVDVNGLDFVQFLFQVRSNREADCNFYDVVKFDFNLVYNDDSFSHLIYIKFRLNISLESGGIFDNFEMRAKMIFVM